MLSEEHRLIAKTADEFVAAEVLPVLDQLESKDWELARHLIKRCGDLGLLGLAAPEQFGGLDLDKASALVVVERIARAASFATTFGGQANLSVLPLVLFGTAEQKAMYLPRLIAGDIVGAYALSESGSGSDALAARTRATRQGDGSWLLTGEKMWISNGGFADLIIVFAKVDGEQFTAFLVERGFPGVSSGKEEHKMGLHGSSTTPIILQDANVPAGNVLGEVGRGHKVALNMLNYGRFSLGAMCAGGAKSAIGDSRATQRAQAVRPADRLVWRHQAQARGDGRTRLCRGEPVLSHGRPPRCGVGGRRKTTPTGQGVRGVRDRGVDRKVAGTEALDYVLDENVQIHGGNGFVRDYTAERYYRDARVNRIFEGTNEINRLLIPGMLVRRGLKGELPLVAAAKRLQNDILRWRRRAPSDDHGGWPRSAGRWAPSSKSR